MLKLKNKIDWFVFILSSIGFIIFGILSKNINKYDYNVALGFLIGICLMLVIISLDNIEKKKEKEKNIK